MGTVTDRAGLVNKLLENLKELIAEGAEPAELKEAAAKTGNQQLAAKADDLALLLESYQQYVDRHGLERTLGPGRAAEQNRASEVPA